jgi:hypothetical protein
LIFQGTQRTLHRSTPDHEHVRRGVVAQSRAPIGHYERPCMRWCSLLPPDVTRNRPGRSPYRGDVLPADDYYENFYFTQEHRSIDSDIEIDLFYFISRRGLLLLGVATRYPARMKIWNNFARLYTTARSERHWLRAVKRSANEKLARRK